MRAGDWGFRGMDGEARGSRSGALRGRANERRIPCRLVVEPISMRWIAILVCWAALVAARSTSMGQGAPTPKGATPLLMPPAPLALPNLFDGWTEEGQPQTYTD